MIHERISPVYQIRSTSITNWVSKPQGQMLHFLFRDVIRWLLRKIMAPVLYRNSLKHSRIINAPFVAIIFLLFCFSPRLNYFPFSVILIQNSFFFFTFICSFVTS